MLSFCLGSCSAEGRPVPLSTRPRPTPIESHRLRAIGLGVDSMQDDQGALKPRSCTGWQEVGP